LPLDFGFAVDDLGLRGSFCVLQRRFLTRLRFQLGLFDLFLLQRQGVLHRVRLRLRLQNTHLRLPLGLFHITCFLRLRLQLGDLYLLSLDLLLGA